LAFAEEIDGKTTSRIKNPAVVGAVIELGHCLDLLSTAGVQAVKLAHDHFLHFCDAAGSEVPKNHLGDDLLLRNLDCAVINHVHKARAETNLPEFDTVRGVFLEGERIYENSGFREKTHIRICVRNHENIKGVFRVPDDQLQP
jgi:hypothetical protein